MRFPQKRGRLVIEKQRRRQMVCRRVEAKERACRKNCGSVSKHMRPSNCVETDMAKQACPGKCSWCPSRRALRSVSEELRPSRCVEASVPKQVCPVRCSHEKWILKLAMGHIVSKVFLTDTRSLRNVGTRYCCCREGGSPLAMGPGAAVGTTVAMVLDGSRTKHLTGETLQALRTI